MYLFKNQTNPIHYDKVLQYQRFIFGLKNGVLYNIISYNDSDFKTKIFRKNSDCKWNIHPRTYIQR